MTRHRTSAADPIRAPAEVSIPYRILIVEDEEILAGNLETYFERCACEVRTAPDGEQAIRMLDFFRPDALVLDYTLPGIDGLRTYAEIVRRHGRKIDCVMITGTPDERLVRDAREKGILHLLCKPFSFSELRRLLKAPAPASAGDAQDACA